MGRYMGYKKAVPENIKVVPVNRDNGIRYIVIDADTGEVFDDAQGYGFTSAKKAYAAFYYKSRSKEDFKQEHQTEDAVIAWCKEHRSAVRHIQDGFFYAVKDGCDESSYEIAKQSLEEDNLLETLPFSINDLLRFMK